MTGPTVAGHPLRVVVAGGGLAVLETLAALRALAQDRVAVTVLAPRPGGELRLLAEQTGCQVLDDALEWVDPITKVAHTEDRQALPYDALVVAVGGRSVSQTPCAIRVDGRCTDQALDDLLRDAGAGAVKSAVFVVPERAARAPALYDLALDAAAGARELGVGLRLSLVTAAEEPLQEYGPQVARDTRARLETAGVALVTAAHALVPGPGQVVVPSLRLTIAADRVYALPSMLGPAVRGLPGAAHGFLPVDPYGRVRGVRDIYAAGDATDTPLKSGAVAAAQAERVARTIAARAGADVAPVPFCRPAPHPPFATRRGRMARIGADDVRVSPPPDDDVTDLDDTTTYLTTFRRGRGRPAAAPRV